MTIRLTSEECYTDINTFYKKVALKIGFEIEDIDKLRFDCRDILVTAFVKDTIGDFYSNECCTTNGNFAFIWACFGPKATLIPRDAEDLYRVEVGRNFIIQEGDNYGI